MECIDEPIPIVVCWYPLGNFRPLLKYFCRLRDLGKLTIILARDDQGFQFYKLAIAPKK
jgi:hypothetical protein